MNPDTNVKEGIPNNNIEKVVTSPINTETKSIQPDSSKKSGFFSGFFGSSNAQNPQDENARKENCEKKCKENCNKPKGYLWGGKKHRSKKNKNSKKKTRKSKSKKSRKSKK